jgi:epoxyqueuosine reductase
MRNSNTRVATKQQKSAPSGLKEEIIALAQRMGIDKIGFTSRERLDDAPPSGDLSYVLPSARSAISLVIAFDKPAIRAYLAKEDRLAHARDHAAAYIKLGEVAQAIQNLLQDKGYEASAPFVNNKYRKGQPYMAMVPPLSHRYVAVAAGIGWIGWSGNVITPEHGAAIAITSIVTSADLEPDPIAEGDICKNCSLCAASCPSHFMAMKEETSVRVAGHTYIHNKKAANLRCVVSCGGANGMRTPDAKWSTWSYKVLDLPGPGDDEAFKQKVFEYGQDPKNRLLKAFLQEPSEVDLFPDWEHFNQYVDETFVNKGLFTCGNCMLMCWPEMKDRKENYRLLTTSGRVVRGPEGPVVVRDQD